MEEIRCQACKLNQFMTISGNCRRCRVPLAKKVEAPVLVAPPPRPTPKQRYKSVSTDGRKFAPRPIAEGIGFALWMVRISTGMSRQDLAHKASMVRTYISNLENGRAMPTIENIRRLAVALNYPPMGIVRLAEARSSCLKSL